MSPVAVAATHMSWCQCELSDCWCVHSLIQTAVWGPPSSYPPPPELGQWEWGGWVLQEPCAPSPPLWPWRPPFTITHLSETAGDLPAHRYLRHSSAAGWLEGPLTSQP